MSYLCSVSGSKRTLIYQAEEGARLEAENKDLAFRIAQLKESHAYVPVFILDMIQTIVRLRYMLPVLNLSRATVI